MSDLPYSKVCLCAFLWCEYGTKTNVYQTKKIGLIENMAIPFQLINYSSPK